MKHFLNLLSSIRLGFYLLILTSFVLCAGAVTAEFFMNDYHDLNFMRFPVWLMQHAEQPMLYSWILVLFTVLFFLALNTFACIVTYFQSIFERRYSLRRTSILLFHVCFLFFLLGHCFYEFTGTQEILMLEKGRIHSVGVTGLQITPVSIVKESIVINEESVPVGTKAVINAVTNREIKSTISLESMKPGFANGYSFHLSMKDKDLSDTQVRIIVRRDYGLYALAVGGVIAVIAVILFMVNSARRSNHHLTDNRHFDS
jgi:hypothetical protein